MTKYTVLTFLLVIGSLLAHGQNKISKESVLITSLNEKTGTSLNENGELVVNVKPKDVRKFKAAGFVRYSDFGAKGDGKSDDIDAIAGTHAFANQQGLRVKANENTTFYIGGKERAVIVRTDTEFGTAKFIIDDTEVQNRKAPVFTISSDLKPFKLESIVSLRRNQKKIDASLPAPCLITATNSNVKHYIRFGLNQNNGSPQTDIFLSDENGNVDRTRRLSGILIRSRI